MTPPKASPKAGGLPCELIRAVWPENSLVRPDDCGGMYGYYRFWRFCRTPTYEEYETYRDWMPEDFDPDPFDAEEVNAETTRIKQWRRMAEE